MKKFSNIKTLATVAFCAFMVAGVFAIVSCSPSNSASSKSGGDLASAYPMHQANMTENGAGLASTHYALNQDCNSCHTGDLNAEVATLSGTDGAEPALGSSYYMDSETCLSCHGGSWEELAKQTDSLGDYNPHASIHGDIENCNECHKGHENQVDVCSECHDNGGQTMQGTVVE